MAFVVAAGLGGIVMASPLDQTDNQVMHSSQDTPRCPNGHTSSIFTESNVTSIVQARFDKPRLAPELEHFSGGCLRSRKAGNAELDLTACFEDFSLADPVKLTLQAIHLSDAGPIDVIVEHGAGLNAACFKPTMPIIGFVGGQEIGGHLAKTGFGLVWGKQALNIFVQMRLIFFDRPEVVTSTSYNLLRGSFLGMHRIASNDFSSQRYLLQDPRGSHNLVFLAVPGLLRQHIL